MGFVFEEGEAVDVGAAGEHDFEFVEGTSLTDSGDSTLVFTEGTGIGGALIIDDFERGNLDPYSGDLGFFQTVTSGVLEGGVSCANTEPDQTEQFRMYSIKGEGLPNYFELGDTLRMNFVYDDTNHDFEINWAHSSNNPYDNHYWAELDPERDASFRLGGRDDGSNFDSYAVSSWDGTPYVGQELIWEIDWASDGTVTSRLLELDESEIISISGKDGRYDGNVGIGYDINPQDLGGSLPDAAVRWDNVRKF